MKKPARAPGAPAKARPTTTGVAKATKARKTPHIAAKTSTKRVGRPRRKRKPRAYDSNFIGLALAYLDTLGGNVFAAAKQLHIPINTLRFWMDKRAGEPDISRARERGWDGINSQLETNVAALLAMTRAKARKAGLQECATSVGIYIDKMKVVYDVRVRAQSAGAQQSENPLIAAKDKYEKMVTDALERAAERGINITRDVVVAGIITRLPEAAQFIETGPTELGKVG